MSSFSNLYREEKDKIVCQLCQHYCHLKDGQIGVCGVNKNEGGKLLNLVYGKISAINLDPIEKKPLYHFLPSSNSLSIGTVGCNFKCPFCQNWQISQTSNLEGSYSVTPQELVNIAIENGAKSISYTYNEPTIFWPFAKDVAILAKDAGLKNVFVSNGFESKEVIEDAKGLLDAFNIDLKSFNKDYYKKSLKGNLDGVLDTIKRVASSGFWLEITTLIVPEVNDSDKELEQIAKFISSIDRDIPWHISAFHPDYKEIDKEATPVERLKKAYKIGKDVGLNYVYIGNILDDGVTRCPNCGEELIKRVGFSVVENRLIDGACFKCKTKIAGVWR